MIAISQVKVSQAEREPATLGEFFQETGDSRKPLRTRICVSYLLLDSNHTEPNRFALTLRVFQACFLCKLFRFEGLRQWREFTIDVLEKQPLFDCLCHSSFIS